MIKCLRLVQSFDAPRMAQELRALEGVLWQPHYQALHYEGRWTALALRSVSGRVEDLMVSPQEGARYQDTPLLETCPYLRDVLGAFHCPLRGVRLMKLEAGAAIKEHRDAQLYAEKGEARFHIPILTHPDVEFLLDGERVPLLAGECWYLNFDLPHAVRNPSPVDRVHLVIDATVDDWLRARLADPRNTHRRDMQELDRYSADEKRSMIASLRKMGTETSLRMAAEIEAGLRG